MVKRFLCDLFTDRNLANAVTGRQTWKDGTDAGNGQRRCEGARKDQPRSNSHSGCKSIPIEESFITELLIGVIGILFDRR